MTISTRTPEGEFNRCPVCGQVSCQQFSLPAGDAPCPACGVLLWYIQVGESVRYLKPPDNHPLNLSDPGSRLTFFRELARQLGYGPDELSGLSDTWGLDSLELVELVMEWEDSQESAE